ncbi:MAG: DUF3108 domain-containing protein [Bradymonadia bacterium]
MRHLMSKNTLATAFAAALLAFAGVASAQEKAPEPAKIPADSPVKAKGKKVPMLKAKPVSSKVKGKKIKVKPGKKGHIVSKKSKKRANRYPHRRPKTSPEQMKIPAMGQIPFEPGERLVFKVRMLNAEAADVILGVGAPYELMGRNVVPLVGWMRSSEFLAKFYPIDDKVSVLVEESNFLPLKTDFEIKENGKDLRYLSVYDPKKSVVRSTRVKNGDKVHPLRRTHNYVAGPYDALSMLFALRRMDLKPGMKFSFYAWDGRRERFVTISVDKQEKVWTPAGWFETHKIDIETKITGGFIKKADLDKAPQKGTLWLGLDPHRTPVKLSSPTKLGEASAVLVKQYKEKV